MGTKKLTIAMNGITGRMGYRQHLVRSILPIRDEGLELADGTRVEVDPAGGFTLPNGAYVRRDASGALNLPNGARCVPRRRPRCRRR